MYTSTRVHEYTKLYYVLHGETGRRGHTGTHTYEYSYEYNPGVESEPGGERERERERES